MNNHNMVATFPKFEPKDLETVQAIRKEFDSSFKIFDPHLTLIFPDDQNLGRNLETHARTVASQNKAIGIKLDSALYMPPNYDGDDHYVFLIPSIGLREILNLHAKLY